MQSVTIPVSTELAERLSQVADQLSRLLELGLREYNATQLLSNSEAAELLEFLAHLPSPETALALQPSDRLQGRIHELLDKSKAGQLTLAEEQEWQQYAFLEHLMRVAKATALLKLQQTDR